IENCGVTTICATPSIMNVVVREIEKREYSGIRNLMTGGESLSTELATKMQDLAFRVENYYGPTEATVLATAWSPGMDKLSKPSIGIPVANTPVYVLDDNQQSVPVGIPGELYIGGSGVARGYLNHRDLTDEFFRNDPFSDDPTERIYRTGDIVRYLPTGEIEFIGRADKQIKIRGFRVELGEIEAVVRRQSGVKDCVAITRENDSGQKQIIAYLKSENQNPETYDLHETISSLLPPHMVPAGFITLAEFPLTANGKVDTTALQDIEFDSSTENNYVPPQSEIEQQIHNIWCEVIGRKKISIEDDFYHTGGDSLSSIQVVCMASDRGLEFSISEMFEFPTIASISKRLAARKHAKEFTNASLSFLSHNVQQLYGELPGPDTQESPNDFLQTPQAVIKLKDGTLPAIFLIHPAGGSALCYRSLATMINSNHAIYGLESDHASSAESLEDIATAYLTTILDVQPDGPYIVGGWALGGILAFEVVRQLESMKKKIELLVIIDSPLPD
ncbi:MAG: AMP-binding protein, partial [bacterium]|nr:AMP-binding protein [bacterium]